MENKTTEILENPAAMQLRLASRELLKNDKLKTDTWYKVSFVFNVDGQNIATVNDIKTEKCIQEVKKSETDSNLVDLRDWVKEYDDVMEENKDLNSKYKVSKSVDELKRGLNKFYKTKVLAKE
jgi:hypothetical protein